ncbi:MAG: exodeoxyribonuclease VII large subunit [Thiomicrorhabdus sp.]|nr:MAG: exodeoxyribonuclease VII large subunit [Thiomicrorhabdus sp.]
MRFLEVPFREKDLAKALGARWDGASKKWYVPTDLIDQIDEFSQWLPLDEGSSTILSGSSSNTASAGNLTFDLNSNADFEQGGPPAAEKEVKGIQLSALLRRVQQALRQCLPGATWVVAEIANINNSRGHIYLELTESNGQGQTVASSRAMIWQSQAQGLLSRFEADTGSALAIGQKILLLAEVSFHEQYGFSMVIQDIDSSYTLGELEQNLINLRKQLIKEGIYQQNRQFKLPADFFRIAVIAPPAAAGLGDFRADADMLQKAGLCDFKYFYSAFQGDSAEKELVSAFEAVHALHHANAFDVLVVIRGGGAKLDLNMLNLYPIAKALCDAKLPVLTGIGHERDNTILDEVAHSRFDTPSKVVAFIRHEIIQQAQQAKTNWQNIEHSSRLKIKYLEQDLNQLDQHIRHSSMNAINQSKQQLEPLQNTVQRLSEASVQRATQNIRELKQAIDAQLKTRIKMKKIEIDQLILTAEKEAERVLESRQQQIIQWISLILSSGPKTQLNRGFNIAKNLETGKPVTTASEALQVTELSLEFVDGSVTAKVDQDKGITH